jgi:hypothetical protein
MHRWCLGRSVPWHCVIPRLGDRSPHGSWGSKNIQRSNHRPKKENCHDDLVPAFSFPGIASLGAGGRSSYGFCSSKKIE